MVDSPADVGDPDALRIVREDPIAPAVARRPPELGSDGSDHDRGCLRLIVIGATVFLGLPALIEGLVAAGLNDLVLPALLVCLVGAGLLIRRVAGVGASRALPADAGREVRLLGAARTATQAAMTLYPSADGTPFDPADDTHRRVAELIHGCRAQDGLGLDPAGSELRISLLCLDGAQRSPEVRGVDWRAIAEWLDARDDARRAWLAAIACAERDSVGRGVRALEMLDAADAGALVERVVADMQARGHWTARGVLAVRRGEAETIDGLISDAPPGQLDSLVALMAARWRLAPEAAVFGDWLASPEHATALMAAPLSGADPSRWQMILEHPSLAVVTVAARALISGRSERAGPAARVVLGRADARGAVTDAAQPHPIEPLVVDAMALLGQTGTLDDMRLLAPWRDVPRVGERARRSQAELRSWIDVGDHGGGLAIAVDPLGGGLSTAEDVAEGGLSPVDSAGG